MMDDARQPTDSEGSLFRALYVQLPDAVALYQPVREAGEPATDYRIVDANPQFLSAFGLTPDSPVGRSATEVFGALEPPFRDALAAVVENGAPVRLDVRFARFDRDYEVTVVPLPPAGLATVFRDVTERMRGERALRDSEQFLHRSQNVARVGSYRLEVATGRWTSSPALDELFGISGEFPRDVDGWLSIVHPSERDEMRRYLEADVIGSGIRFDCRYRIVRQRDGAVRWVHGRGDLEKDAAGRPTFMIGSVQDVTDATTQEQALRTSEEIFRRVFELFPGPVALVEHDATIINCNDEFSRILGRERDALIGGKTTAFDSWVDPAKRSATYQSLSDGNPVDWVEAEIRRPDGQVRLMQISGRPFELDGRTVILVVGRDVTELRALEQQMLHARKLESLGVLAGGIAHDFNNLLTGILGYADVARRDVAQLSPARASLEGIETAARRAADLCRQLLAYSGRGRFVVQALKLQELVQTMEPVISATVGKRAVVNYRLDADAPAIEGDASQLRQVVTNLVVNATEAVGGGAGTITIAVGTVDCDEDALRACVGGAALAVGRYVYLEVSDTGCGIPAADVERIFDPFFSTKFTGRGLGLPAVLGIARGHRGALKVRTRPGQGTDLRVLFPSSRAVAAPAAGQAESKAVGTGGGCVLLVDDEETIRNLGRRILRTGGLEVLVAADGRDAVAKFASASARVDLVILDLTMPEFDGEACFQELCKLRPDVKVLLSSGYDEQDVVGRFGRHAPAGFIQKPYTAGELLAKVREMLSTPSPPP